MGTAETHKGFGLVQLKGSLEQARVNVDTALPALVQAHQLAQRSQDTELTDKLLAVITALRHIQTTLGQAATTPLGDKVTLDKGQLKKGSDDVRSVGRRSVEAFSCVMLLWRGCGADLQNLVIDKTVVPEARADRCLPKPLEFEGFVIAVSERLPWVELCVTA